MYLLPVYAFYQIEGVVKDISAHSVSVFGNYAFLGTSTQLKVVDISNPSNPQLLNTANNLYQGRTVVQDSLAYIASYYQSIKIVNVTDPFQPVLVAQVDSLGQFSKFAVSDHFLYIYSSDLTMRIIDISDMSNPQSAGSCQLLRLPSVITIADGLMS
jgi:hypothetical protein